MAVFRLGNVVYSSILTFERNFVIKQKKKKTCDIKVSNFMRRNAV
jgi:hypothetical protein